MEQTLKKLAWYSLLTLIMVVIIGVALLSGKKEKIEQNLSGSGLGSAPVNIIGTRTGSSTTAVAFATGATGGRSATSTYETYIGRDVDLAIYDIYFKAASTSANASFSVLSSPDSFCAATSTAYYAALNNYTKGQVSWFDAGDHFSNKVHSTSLTAATSTISIENPAAGTRKQIILENLNSPCLALQASGSSTEMQVTLSTKQK